MSLVDDYYSVDALRVNDTKTFGAEVIKIALGKTPNVEMTFQDFAAKYPVARAAMNSPTGLSNTDMVVFIQGTTRRHIINVPPLHKLLPMLDSLGFDPAAMVGGAQNLGYDPANPPKSPTVVPATAHVPTTYTYPWPQYYIDLFDGGTLTNQEVFLHRVGDYSVAGCR